LSVKSGFGVTAPGGVDEVESILWSWSSSATLFRETVKLADGMWEIKVQGRWRWAVRGN
jgi:hypothetical protein